MTRGLLVLRVASAVLVLPSVTMAGAPGTAATRQFAAARQAPMARQPTTVRVAAPEIPCPAPTPPVARPTRPAPPPLNPAHRTVGGPELATAGLVLPAGAPTPPKITATSWLVTDLTTGAVLGGCGPHEYGVPASVQKLLLAATVMPRLDPAQLIEVTESDLDFEPGSSAVGLVRGGRYSVETLWLGLILNSGNDAANVLARLGGGTGGMAGGVAAMNAEARRLGAYQTHAATPSGLDGPGQFTSAYDLALIARACFAREDFRRYAATRMAQVPAQTAGNTKGFPIWNDNKLLHNYPGALGGKTGFTDLARHSFVGAAERNGRTLLVTLLGAESQPLAGWQQGAALLDWGFALPTNARVGQLVSPGQVDSRGRIPSQAAGTEARAEVDPRWRPNWLLMAGAPVILLGILLTILFLLRRRRLADD
ncbi:D-alanyl-D-alanine carboxypeptidase family protein [Plantactinospora soyae]|uniref:D-alanyl-D-alanine carboxypeptidase (Penicillin-binding protein 5/6) n=1 Tax=Plantactinospora soyae TaxID=1544732 RepID=A0A927M133_9ACTN|nr:serine hydrolase [Plantactinospora soyae]MBE1486172.1 D-alanyl-D-alanine carboxypeptidase (penicillin-binding protein 5/6) [Plantactinospora soyae]